MFLGNTAAQEYMVSFKFSKTNIPGFWNCLIGFTSHNKEFLGCNICVFDTEEQINETALRVATKMLKELTK